MEFSGFLAVVDQMVVFWGFWVMEWLDVLRKCSGTAANFRVTELVLADAELIRRKVSDGFF